MSWLLAIVAGLSDAFRGGLWKPKDNFPNKRIGLLLLALVVSMAVGATWWQFLVFALWLNLFGVWAGTGHFMGRIVTEDAYPLESYGERENFQWNDNKWVNVGWMGVVWTAPALVLSFWTPAWLAVLPCFMVAFPVGSYLAVKILKDPEKRWILAEGLRSFLAVLGIVLWVNA